MWKLISLSALLIVAQAADIQDIYGDWIQVAFYPVSSYIPICIRFSFDKNIENMQCVYADGRNATTVRVFIMSAAGEVTHRASTPIMIVDTAAEVMPALNISCKCDGKDYRDRTVARIVNNDYFILYANIAPSKESTRTEIEQNFAMLFGRQVVSEKALSDVMTNIEELKNRRGAMMCVEENYNGFKKSGNDVL